MLISYEWLQSYFEKPLPAPEKIAELFTMHAFELEGMEKVRDDTVLDLKILPNRAHDCLSHDGIARELSVLSGIPLKKVTSYLPTGKAGKLQVTRTEHKLKITVEDQKLCRRYAGRIFENIKIGESPEWMKRRLDAIGQRSINNVVDITNYVMFATGQPLHAFDMDKLARKGNEVEIIVRSARAGEKLVTLDGKDIDFDETMLAICDAEKPLALAGIKGGKWAEVDSSTRHIILESANFEPTSTRKTSQKIGLRTDSEKRFENEITPELAGRGMKLASRLLAEFAAGPETKIAEIIDVYPRIRRPYKVGVSTAEVNKLLGTNISEVETEKIIARLGFSFEKVNDPIKKVLELAPKFEGVPYKYGASISYEAPDVFDCSSFIAYLYSQAGLGLPRRAIDQYFYCYPVEKDDLKEGDIIFSSNKGQGPNTPSYKESQEFSPGEKTEEEVDHNGIYIGNGNVIHASGQWHKNSVVIEKLNDSPAFKNTRGYRRVARDTEARFIVTVPAERLDLMSSRSFLVSGIKEDLIEEIGRIYGYENVPSNQPERSRSAEINKLVYYSNLIRKVLQEVGFSEIMTYSFGFRGDIQVLNPIAEDKKFLRGRLYDGLFQALELNVRNAPLLGLEKICVFEIGKIFPSDGERWSVALGVASRDKKISVHDNLLHATERLEHALGIPLGGEIINSIFEFNLDNLIEKLPETDHYDFPASIDKTYAPISSYPFVLRDIAVFVPKEVSSDKILGVISNTGGGLLARERLFDVFEKDGKVSYAFNLVFQSHEKTLSDEEVNKIMKNITDELNSRKGWIVR